MSIANLADSSINEWAIFLDILHSHKVLTVAQWEFGHILPWNKSGIEHVETVGVSYCVGVAWYSQTTGAIGVAHLDDATNIPATVFLMRKTLDRFYAFTGLNKEFLELTVEEIQRQNWKIISTKIEWDGFLYNKSLWNLIVSVGGAVHNSVRVNRPRSENLISEDWRPFSGVSLEWMWVLYPAILVNHDDPNENFRKLWQSQPSRLKPFLKNKEFQDTWERWQSFFENWY